MAEVKHVKRDCDNCGGTIRAYGHRKDTDKIFCSKECEKDHYRVTKSCPNCGDGFEVLKSILEGENPRTEGKYCSKDCMDEYRSENWVGENNPLWIDSAVECDQCGKEFQKRPAKIDAHNKQFCSRSCHGEWISENNRGENHPRWVEDRSQYDFYESPKWRNVRQKVWQRDGYTCQHCGETDTLIHAHHIEHIPDGAKFDMENLVTLCVSCHAKHHNSGMELDIAGVL